MKKSRQKKIIKILIFSMATIVCGGVIFLCAFFGYCPVVGRLIAESKLSSYAGHQVEARFEWIYHCCYYEVGSGMKLKYYLKDDTIYHSSEDSRIEREANSRYSEFKKLNQSDSIEWPIKVNIYSKLDGSDTAKSYSKVTVNSVRESVPLDRQASKERMCELAERILSSLDVNCTSICFYYSNQGGDYMIRHDFGKHTIEPGELLQYAEEYKPL